MTSQTLLRPANLGDLPEARRPRCLINALKSLRAVAARYVKRAYVFHGTVTVAAIRLWLRA